MTTPTVAEMKAIIIWLLRWAFCLGIMAGTLQAQPQRFDEQWRWAQFTTEEGLPSNRVFDLVETPSGAIWANTQKGLAWFNGYYWTATGAEKGLPELRASQVAPASGNQILVLMNGELYRGDEHGFKKTVIAIDGQPIVVSGIAALPDQRHLIISNSTLYLLDGDVLSPYKLPPDLWNQKIEQVYSTGGGAVWINAQKGLYRNAGSDWMLALASPRVPFELTDVAGNAEGRCLVSVRFPAESRGVWEFELKRQPRLLHEGVWKFVETAEVAQNGDAAAVLETGGIRWRRAGVWQTVERPPRQMKDILFLKFRTNGDFWVGTESALCLHRTSSTRWINWAHSQMDQQGAINEILVARDGAIWLARGVGIEIHRKDGAIEILERINGTSLGLVTGLAEDLAGNIWIASGLGADGAYRFDGKRWEQFGQKDGLGARFIHKIVAGRKGRLWFLGLAGFDVSGDYDVKGPGVFVYDGKTIERWEHSDELLSGRVYGFAEGLDGEYWFATVLGLSRWNNGRWTHWTTSEGLRIARVFTVAVDHQNRLWFGDQHSGLGFIKDDSVGYLTTKDGLVSDAVWDLKVGTDGALWVATRGGLSSYFQGTWTTFGPDSGLSNTRLWPVLPTSANIYIGTTGGGAVILNREDQGLHDPVVVMAEHAIENNSPVLRWSAYSYFGELNSRDIETRYRIDDGEFSAWSKKREIVLTALSRGIHSFQVQAKGFFGTYDSAGQRISFRIPNPYYLEPLFLWSVAVLLFGLIAVTTVYVVKERKFVSTISESEGRYRCVVEHINDALMVDDINGNVVYANDQFFRLFGFERRGLGRIKLEDYAAPESRDVLRDRHYRRLRGDTAPTHFEYEAFRQDGERLWLDVHVVLVVDSAGRVTGTQSVIRDITGRKKAESELRRSEGYRGTVWESSLDGMRLTDAEGKVVLVNDAYCRLMEKPREALEGCLLSEAYDEERRDYIIEKHHERFRNRSVPPHREEELVLWNGKKLFLELSNSFLSPFEDPPLLLSVFRDITERKQAEENLRVKDNAIASAITGFAIGDLNGKITYVNAAWLRMFGFETANQVIGTTPADHAQNPADTSAILDSLNSTGQWMGELPGKRRDGLGFHVHLVANLVVDRAGAPICMVASFLDITARKQVEEALQRSEKRYREVVENASDIIYSTDLTGRFIHANAAALQAVGYPLEELRTFSYLDLILPDYRGKMQTTYVQQFREKRPSSYVEFPFSNSSGDVRWFGQNASLILEGRNIVGFQVIARDITERKQMEQTLRRSRELFDLAGQLAKVGAWELDLETQILSWSEEVYRIHEVDPATRLSIAEAIKFYAPEARPLIAAAVQDCIDSGAPWDLELPLITAQGRRIWVRAQGAAEVRGGRAVRLYGAFQDVTNRRVANESLQLQSTALNAAANAIVIADRSGVIEWVNPAFTGLSGYTAAEAIGQNPRLLDSGHHDPTFYQSLWKTILSGQVWHGEITNRHKDGSLYTEDQTITPVMDESGAITHFVAIKEDITERLQLQTQFLQSQKMESVGRLAGGIAHDFNNLLTIINGNADLALMGMKQTDPLQTSFQDIRRAGERAAGLTRQLLAFSRKQVIKPQELSLNNLVADLQRMLPRLIGEDIALVFALAEKLGIVKADPGQIEQVILNLAVNARDAMPTGGTLIIETRDVDLDELYAARHQSMRPGPHVMLAISDTGVGMDAATRAQIFEPFFTTKGLGKGTGLGLSTVYGIVEQSGGSISVYSEVGQGTTFKIYLPRVEKSVGKERPAPDATAARGRETILIVEDEDVLRNLAKRYIESAGYKVLDAANGADALRLLERYEEPLHLLLTDVVMPGISGRELAERLGQIYPAVKVLFMSGYTDDAISHHGVLDAGVHLISKPFTIQELTRAVREVLDTDPSSELAARRK